jgi:hypothetical protein
VIEQAAYLLIAAGAFVFIVSFLGYCGAVKESRVLLGMVSVSGCLGNSFPSEQLTVDVCCHFFLERDCLTTPPRTEHINLILQMNIDIFKKN